MRSDVTTTEDAAAIARMERRLFATRADRAAQQAAAQKTAPPPPLATSGRGWRVTDPPGAASHEEIEKMARDVFDLMFHGVAFPKHWRVRWGEVDHSDPANPLSYAVAATVTSAKIIIVDRRYGPGRSVDSLIETLCHELTHVLHPEEIHGPAFKRPLGMVRAYLNGLKEPPELAGRPARPTTVPVGARPSRPEAAPLGPATNGPRWGPRWGTDPDGWERRG